MRDRNRPVQCSPRAGSVSPHAPRAPRGFPVTAVHDTTCLPTAVGASTALVIAPRLPVVPDQRRAALELDLEVVIPAFNEAERLPRTISSTAEYLAAQPWRSQIVVVDNGSS